MNSVSSLDDQTSAAIRDAISAAQSGRYPDAVSIGEQALANGGNAAALNAMLGTLHCQSGNLEAGTRHLRAAHADRPNDPVIATNLVTALAQQGQKADALEVLTEDLANSDPSLQLQRIRAYLAQEVGLNNVAIQAYENIVAAAPDDWEAWNNLGNVWRLSGDAEASVKALDRAFQLIPVSPPIRLNYAMALAAAGRVDEAEERLRQMAADYPRDTKPLQELYAILRELGREEDALDVIAAAHERDPADLNVAILLAGQQLNVQSPVAAEKTYRRILEAQPAHDLATLGLAIVFELTNRADELLELIDELDGRGVSADAANFVRAMGFRRAKRFDEGLAALSKVPEDLESVRRQHLLGQLEEGAGNYDKAFTAFSWMNDLQARDLTKPQQRAATYRERVRSQREALSKDWLDSWRPGTIDDGNASPAFIVGFPRSGTTLLDTMLMGHPLVEVLEEEPALLEAAKVLEPFDQLPNASDEQIAKSREIYFKAAAERVSIEPGKLLVDKNPLSLNALPLIHRLFPDAKVILALRHPCDALLSCYASNFKLNDGMSSFLQLDTAAELYDLSFSYFEKARELIGTPVHEIRYEDLVEDRERGLRGLIDYLGLDWADEVLDHQATAKSRGRIKTPSYHQVVQPIYTQSAGRWMNYLKQLEPVIPVLEPWVARYGYTL